MKTRVLSSIIMLPLAAVLYVGGPLLWAFAFLIAIMGITEFYRGFRSLDIRPCRPIGWISAIAIYAIIVFDRDESFYLLWFTGVITASMLYLFKIDKRQLSDSMATIVGAFYVVFFSAHIVLIDKSDKSPMIWIVVLSAFGTDIFAYFTGYFLGKHKLCPKISPKKTIEGAVGGVIGSMFLCSLFGFFIFDESILHFITIGLIGSIVAQIGDLTASIFKRKMGIKDYGNLIPGHGGILDRFDSVLFTAPFVYYYVVLVMY